jgi:hypothetical protein
MAVEMDLRLADSTGALKVSMRADSTVVSSVETRAVQWAVQRAGKMAEMWADHLAPQKARWRGSKRAGKLEEM